MNNEYGMIKEWTGSPHVVSLQVPPENLEENAPSQNIAAQGAALGAPEGPDDPNLAIIIQRWPDLPPAMKSGILAMVRQRAERDQAPIR